MSMSGCTYKKFLLKSYTCTNTRGIFSILIVQTINILNIPLVFVQVYEFNKNFLDVQPDIDIKTSVLFVNINGIPVMYALF